MDAVFHALADGSRRSIIDTLAAGPVTAGALAESLPIARPGVSRHLRVLLEAGLVEVEQRGRERVYSLRPDAFADADAWLAHHRDLWGQRLDALHTEVARGRRTARRSGTTEKTGRSA
ncbi:metalloregulator ArsR/SmtB family transcription factor [Luteipulveratus sp. YIM 133132]|uniref:Metalloregulator ArsR/SmtB family transcription factor n=1 Tax=Luteipulveratus flavus TaxID=3031728 RepID=A0ABT6CCB0_9MICO|nr:MULTISPECIES: metalloregulator ArsR/SmtB family transcription factor [unclassified Luteipulveratus]MDE9364725.1 metalloregulator ArsR/SmtB family transcription factor [Luteipulveratus sp. YIM 133132]MDF8266143.1 metalloregulator ArsR/SmtB family transcription factor [Luteipulveratus sp. YIM 133296]